MNQDKVKAVIFDFDGVLVESVDVKTKAFANLYSEYGPDIVEKVVAYHLDHCGISRFEKFRYYHRFLLKKELPFLEEQKLGERFSRLVVDAIVASPWVPGAFEFLEEFHRKLLLFVASGTPADELKEIVSRRNMGHYFISVHGSPSSKGDIINEIVKKHGLNREHVLMVGDAIADYEGARKAQVAFLGRICGEKNIFPKDIQCVLDLVPIKNFL